MSAGRTLYLILFLALLFYCLAVFFPQAANFALVINIFALLAALADYFITPGSSLLSAQRTHADRFSIGRFNEVKLEIFNQSGKSLFLKVKDAYPESFESDTGEFAFDLAAGSKASLNYMLFPRRRGAYSFEDIYLRYRSSLGLFWRHLRISSSREVKVYPDLKALQELSVRLSHSSEFGELKMRKRGQGTDFAALREYVSGDDVRSMDWKATARRDRPVLRIYEVEKEQTLMVLVDAGRMMISDLEGLSRFDHALNAALSLVLTGLMNNDQVGIGVFADRPILYMPPRRGKTYFNKILEASADLKPVMVEPDYLGSLSFFAAAHKSRSLMVLISDLTDPTGSQSMLSGLAGLSPRHLPFCVTLRDRNVDRISQEPGIELGAILEKAVATDLIAQRELAFSQLVRRGCLVLDAPPQELSNKLLDKYLEIKARGIL